MIHFRHAWESTHFRGKQNYYYLDRCKSCNKIREWYSDIGGSKAVTVSPDRAAEILLDVFKYTE